MMQAHLLDNPPRYDPSRSYDWNYEHPPEPVVLDVALCAQWAVDSGADCVETNFSCPNVKTCDGQLYMQADAARTIAQAVRQAVGSTPYLIKIGHVTDETMISELVRAVHPYADGLAMTNSVAGTVADKTAELLFGGDPRGICGMATRDAALEQVARFRRAIVEQRVELEIIGVGGISNADDVRAHLNAGAAGVQIATAAMTDPSIGCQIRQSLRVGGS